MGTGNPGGMMAPRTPGFNPAPPPTAATRAPNPNSHQPRMGLQLGLGGRWWDDHGTARKLSLNPDQQHRMDTIFETNKPTLLNLYTNLQREERSTWPTSPTPTSRTKPRSSPPSTASPTPAATSKRKTPTSSSRSASS
jgi:hypothetical protein